MKNKSAPGKSAEDLIHKTPTMPDSLPPLPSIPLGEYEHYKGNHYRVLRVGRHSETLEPMVVYQALYGERGIWVRPAVMFKSTVDVDGVQVPRFRFIGRLRQVAEVDVDCTED